MQPKIEKRKVYPLNSCPFLPPPAPGNHRATFCCCEFDWQHMVDTWTTQGFSGADQQCSGRAGCHLQPASIRGSSESSDSAACRWCHAVDPVYWEVRVRVGLCRNCRCSLGSPELPRQSYLHPHLRIYPDYLLFCRNMYSLRTKIESCEFSLLNTCQNQYWNITGMGNSTDTKCLLKHLFRMLTLSILWTTDDPSEKPVHPSGGHGLLP